MSSVLRRPPTVVRLAEPRDIAAIARIYDHAVRHGTASFEIEPPDENEMSHRRDVLLAGGYPFLVAELGGAVVGYAYAGPYRARPAYRWTIEDSIYIAPQAQRRGLGRALLARLITEAEARGFRQMIAVIGDSAQTPARRRRLARQQLRSWVELARPNSRERGWMLGLASSTQPTPRLRSATCRSRAARGRARGRGARSARSPR